MGLQSDPIDPTKTRLMQPTQQAVLDKGDSLPISNGPKDKEAGLLIL